MINFHAVTKENIKEHNLNWQPIPDHSDRIVIIRGLDLEKQIHYLI